MNDACDAVHSCFIHHARRCPIGPGVSFEHRRSNDRKGPQFRTARRIVIASVDVRYPVSRALRLTGSAITAEPPDAAFCGREQRDELGRSPVLRLVRIDNHRRGRCLGLLCRRDWLGGARGVHTDVVLYAVHHRRPPGGRTDGIAGRRSQNGREAAMDGVHRCRKCAGNG